jgi:hypothetical protein
MMLSYPCDYIPGDVNGNGILIGSDVTYLVRYIGLIGPPPPDSCFNTDNNQWLYSAADVNGDCQVIGSDVTYLVNYYHMIGAPPTYCPFTPPPFHTVENKDIVIIPQISNEKPVSFDMEDKR